MKKIFLIGLFLIISNYAYANGKILKSGFIIDSQTKYENGLISIKFIRDE